MLGSTAKKDPYSFDFDEPQKNSEKDNKQVGGISTSASVNSNKTTKPK